MLSECIYKVLMASGVVTSSDACDLSGAIEAAVLEAQGKQKPVFFVVIDETGAPEYTALWPEFCHEHINNAINEYEIEGASKWKVRSLYAAPVVQPDMIRPDQEALQQIIAAALYDFGGFITTRQKQLVASATDNAADTVEALKEFMEKRGINPCQDVPVLSWQCWIAAAEGKG